VVRDFPLEAIHPHAFKAAEASHCAGDQGKYWEMHDRLFEHQQELAPTDLVTHAQALGLDVGKFNQCLDVSTHAERVRRDLGDGQQAGVTGTPSFFLGVLQPGDTKVRVVRALRGALPYGAFKAVIDAAQSQPQP
jgi:protein-disulfide isomerase